jgi:integrase
MTLDVSKWERAGELDALGAVLPNSKAELLADILTDDDVATLRHLAEAGMGDNSLRALASDLGYLEAWCMSSVGTPLPWPAPLELVLKFVAHHLWDPAQRAADERHGMPPEVAERLRSSGLLRSTGPHAPSTVRRRLSSWSTLHRWRNEEGVFHSPSLRKALRLATRTAGRPRQRKSREAVSLDVLKQILAILDREILRWAPGDGSGARGDVVRAIRDRSMLTLAFAAGGRRRSEICGMSFDQVELREAKSSDGSVVPVLVLHLGRTKTTDAESVLSVSVRGRAVADFVTWQNASALKEGPVYRSIGRWGHLGRRPLSAQSFNAVVKARVEEAGFNPEDFSAHGLRSGYLTEAFLQGLSLPEAMSQSGHRSVSQAASYFKAASGGRGRASGLLE